MPESIKILIVVLITLLIQAAIIFIFMLNFTINKEIFIHVGNQGKRIEDIEERLDAHSQGITNNSRGLQALAPYINGNSRVKKKAKARNGPKK